MEEPLGPAESVQLDADMASDSDDDDGAASVRMEDLTQNNDDEGSGGTDSGSVAASQAAEQAPADEEHETAAAPTRQRRRRRAEETPASTSAADFLPMVPNKPMDDVEAVVLDTLRDSPWSHLYLMRIYPVDEGKRAATHAVVRSRSYMHKWALFAASSVRGLPSLCPFVVYRMTVSRRQPTPADAERFAAVAHHGAVFEIVRAVGWTRLRVTVEALTTQLQWIYAHRTLKRAELRSYVAPGAEGSPTWAADALMLYNRDAGAAVPEDKAVQLALRYEAKTGAAIRAFAQALPVLAANVWSCTRKEGDVSNTVTFRPTMLDPPPSRRPEEMAVWHTFKRCMLDTHYFALYFNALMLLGINFGGVAINAFCTGHALNPGDITRRGNLEERLAYLISYAAERPALLLYDGSFLPGPPPSAEDIRLFQTLLVRASALHSASTLGTQVYHATYTPEGLRQLATSLAAFRAATTATRSTWAPADAAAVDADGGAFTILDSGARLQINPFCMIGEHVVYSWMREHVPAIDVPNADVSLCEYIENGGRLVVVDTAFQVQAVETEMPRSLHRAGVRRFCIAAPSTNEINYTRQNRSTWTDIGAMWHDLSAPDGLRDSLTDPPALAEGELSALIVMYTETLSVARAAVLLRRIPPRAHSVVVFVGNSAIGPLRGEHGSFFQALMTCPWARCSRLVSSTTALLTDTMRFATLLCADKLDDARDFVRDLPVSPDGGAPIAARTVDDLVEHLRHLETQRAAGSLLIAAAGPQTAGALTAALFEERRRGQIAAGEWITVRRRQRGGICDPPVAYWCTHLRERGAPPGAVPGLRWPGACIEVGVRGIGGGLESVLPALFDIEPLLVAEGGRAILPFVHTVVIVVTRTGEPWDGSDLIYAMSRATDQIIFVRDGGPVDPAARAPPRDLGDFFTARAAGSTVLEESRWSSRAFPSKTPFTS